jgi:hypothetical protein
MHDLRWLPRALFATAWLATSAVAATSCGSSAKETKDSAASGSSGDQTSAAATTSSAGAGGGGDGGGEVEGPFAGACEQLCEVLSQIGCSSWPNCETECPDALGAPDECEQAFGDMLQCWLDNKEDFACTPFQVLPPFVCNNFEAAFQECLAGQNSGFADQCEGQVCNSTDAACSCKTFCDASEFKAACSVQAGEVWACSCYDDDQLLGTCTQELVGCDNFAGCCAAFFYDPE